MPSVSIIIATASRPEPLAETLRSLATVQVPDGWSVELLLVENVAQTGAEELVRTFPQGRFTAARYFFEPRRGKSQALNLALAQATGDILLFTDDDVRFPVDWLEKMGAPIVAGRADAVAGAVRLAPHLLRPWMNRTLRAWLASTADYLEADGPSEMCGANMAISRRAVEPIGGFDPELGPGITGGYEETLLSWQIKRAGFKIVTAFGVEVEHHLNPDRLQYQNWIRAATGKGESRAYLAHHWHQRPLASPRLKRFLLGTKLRLRRWCSPRRRPGDEGIAPWELSYVEDLAMYDRYMRELGRPRNYDLKGLRKL